jgi:hypothetical protein
MDNVNNLLEGASPYQILQEQAGKLASKWDKSGLLEGIESSTEQNNMAILLENQAKQLVNEASATTAGTTISTGAGEAWAGVALPLVRRVFGEIVAKDLVSVQPMNLPAGLIFYLDFQYGSSQNFKTAGESLYGATADLKRTDGAFKKGLYGAGEFGYSITQSSITVTDVAAGNSASLNGATENVGGGAAGLATMGILNMDTEFSASNAGQLATGSLAGVQTAGKAQIRKILVPVTSASGYDPEAVRAFTIAQSTNIVEVFPQFTRVETGTVGDYTGDVFAFVVSASGTADTTSPTLTFLKKPSNLNDVGDFEASGSATFPSAGVSTQEIPEINVQLRSDTVSAKTRKLKAQWTPEFAQDLNAYHSIDAEAELTSILSEYISMEIDLEILDMLIQSADTVEAWSAKVAQDLTVSSNTTAGGTANPTFTSTANASGVYYTKMSWFQTLGVKLQKVSNLIHQKTLRGGANWMVVSPKVSTILESIPGFAADSAGDADKYNMGVQKIGAINNRYQVYKNPYMTENTILMGYKGSQFLETGAVFAPYIPLIMTPLVYDPVSFTPRKGIMTRYAKKMVRPDFYGKVHIADLDQI